jgi:hypothetical protein
MEWQLVINLGGLVVIGVASWLFRQLWEAVQRLKQDLNELEVKLPEQYIRKDEFREALNRIYAILERIENKVDGKVDK